MTRVLSIYKDGQLEAINLDFGYWKADRDLTLGPKG